MFRSPSRVTLIAVVAVAMLSRSTLAETPVAPAAEALLIQGDLAGAQRQLEEQLKNDSTDDEARFALGATQTLRGVERLMQSLYRHGLTPAWSTGLPFVRLPVPKNSDPVPLTNRAFRQMIADFSADLKRAEATLAKVKADDVKLPLHVALFRFDFDGDGAAKDNETLWKVFNRVTRVGRRQRVDQPTAEQFVIAFDKADVYWLRGYCHLLQAMCDLHLAHDTQALHDHTVQ